MSVIYRDPSDTTTPMFYIFTVENRYGAPFHKLTPPEGYEFTGEFRPATLDVCLFPGDKDSGPYVDRGSTPLPVLILRPRPKRKRIILEEFCNPPAVIFGGPAWFEAYPKEGFSQALVRLNPGDMKPCPGRVYTRREEEF